MYTKDALGLLSAILCGNAIAVPMKDTHLVKRTFPNPMIPNTQSCSAYDYGALIIGYSIQIGVAFNNGIGCNDVYNALEGHTGTMSAWHCEDDGFGNTALYFNNYEGQGGLINQALESMYPMVNGFNCPDN